MNGQNDPSAQHHPKTGASRSLNTDFTSTTKTINRYIDTRGYCETPVPFTQAVIEGLAPGGGLYVPERIPSLSLDSIIALGEMPYAARAAAIYKAFCIDLPDDIVDTLMRGTYGAQFDTPAICPITTLDSSTHMLELWHGPTSAFKDMALQCLPRFFSASAEAMHARGELDHDFLILVATSGDTGKAALQGFADVAHVRIGVLFPDGGVSDIQRKQMVTQTGNNVFVWAVKGNFDDCQNGVKAVFADTHYAHTLLKEHRVSLSSANSINWGRLAPQIVYYLSAYAELVKMGRLRAGELIDVCVPTGNFGNILAAWYAKQMGAPIGRLLCASNENCVLTDFIQTGVYDITKRAFVLTPSPSMDILVSSNLERQLFELTGRESAPIQKWMNDLREKQCFNVGTEVRSAMQSQFSAACAGNAECLSAIKEVFNEHNYLMDPHTAVAWCVANKLRDTNPVLIASTAHWAKFGNNVYRALHDIAYGEKLPDEVAALSGCELNKLIAQETGMHAIPEGLASLDDKPVRFSDVIEASPDAIENAALKFLCTR